MKTPRIQMNLSIKDAEIILMGLEWLGGGIDNDVEFLRAKIKKAINKKLQK